MSGLSAAPYRFQRSNELLRTYPFTQLPVTRRNTFVGSTLALELPSIVYSTAGAIIESNKILELVVEKRVSDVLFQCFDQGDETGHIEILDCHWWGNANNPANIDANAFIGIEWGSMGVAPPFPAIPGQNVVHLRQQLKDKTQFQLLVANGQVASNIVNFTAPVSGFSGEGHHVQIVMNPYNLTVTAIIDGVSRAQISGADAYPSQTGLYVLTGDHVGLFVCSGVQTAATPISASWTGLNVTSIGSSGLSAQLPV